jgi:hypothetical protein
LFLPGLGVDWNVVKKTAAKKRGTAEAKRTEEQDNNSGIDQAAEAGTGKKTKKPRPVRCIHRHTDVEFRRIFPAVFDGLAEKAKEGGTAETRLLLQIGKFGDPKAAKRRRGKSLSEMLLDELKRRQDEREAAADSKRAEPMAGAKETDIEGATSDGDAENG